jgi:FHA domain
MNEAGPGPGGPRPSAPAGWTAVVMADRAYYDSVVAMGGPDVASIQFPAYCPERRFQLSGREMRVGRRSLSRGLDPEIDLSGPPLDPGVSHLHAVLVAEPDGSWSVVDPGSENGTIVNGSHIATGVRVPLRDGDHISIGAWTVLAIQAWDGRPD